jgi:hypothetical protein
MASRKTEGVALVTGVSSILNKAERSLIQPQAASGIGKDTAFSFAESGASCVVFADRNEEGAREAAETSKKYATNPDYIAIALHVEVTDVESVQNMVDYTQKEYRRIDYFVHSAGVSLVLMIIKTYTDHGRSVPNPLLPCPMCLWKNCSQSHWVTRTPKLRGSPRHKRHWKRFYCQCWINELSRAATGEGSLHYL